MASHDSQNGPSHPFPKKSLTELTSELSEVSKTLFIPLLGRAMADYSTHGFFDPLAHQIRKDFSLDETIPLSGQFREACILRAKMFDDQVQLAFAKSPDKTPVLGVLGAGLCTRAQRLQQQLPLKHVFAMDFEPVIRLRENLFHSYKDHSNAYPATHLAGSILEENWAISMASKLRDKGLNPKDNLITVFTLEGVSMYLQEKEMDRLVEILRQYFAHPVLIFDAVDPFLVGRAYLFPAVAKTGSQFHFGIRRWQKWCQKHDATLVSQHSLVTPTMKGQASQIFTALGMKEIGEAIMKKEPTTFFSKIIDSCANGPWSTIYTLGHVQL